MTRLLFALYRARDSLPCISHIVPVANMQYAKARSISSKYLHNTVLHCVVPENIHTPPTEGIGISRGVGDQRPRKILRGGVLYQFILFFPDRFHYSYMLNFLFAFCLPIRGHKH